MGGKLKVYLTVTEWGSWSGFMWLRIENSARAFVNRIMRRVA
jgi:hypothetical protein